MSFVQDSMVVNEKLIYSTHPHKIVFAPSLIILLLAPLLGIFLPEYLQFNRPLWHGFYFHELAAGIVAIVGVLAFIKAYIMYTTSEYGITDKRVMMKSGFVSIASIEVFIQRIESVSITQTFVGQMLNYGTVIVIGTGGTADYYPNVPQPVKFRNAIMSQMSQVRDRGN